jgi:dTDP-4-dehydrorhamnose reductase
MAKQHLSIFKLKIVAQFSYTKHSISLNRYIPLDCYRKVKLKMPPVKVLILGVTGMLGHTLFSEWVNDNEFEIYGTARNPHNLNCWFPLDYAKKIISPVYAEDLESLTICLAELKPQVVINCIGIIKQLPSAQDAIKTITINALFPHRLAMVCKAIGARLIQISTDCVFSGTKGDYREDDLPDPLDLYGQTKLLGEVSYPHCLTIRTSIIGHELNEMNGLLEWFLSQEKEVKGFTHAIYSGFPTIELARILKDFVIKSPVLQGLYQISADPISKYELLKLIAQIYQKPIEIEPDDGLRVNRSLNSARFREFSGYSPPSWPELIHGMYRNFIATPHYKNRWIQGEKVTTPV